jgi:DNA-binding protein HU-beta
MNKRDLVRYVSDVPHISGTAARRPVDTLIAGITQALRNGDEVTLVGFGSFMVRKRPARHGVIRVRVLLNFEPLESRHWAKP